MTRERIDRREFLTEAGRAAAGLSLGAAALAAAGCATGGPRVYAQAGSVSPRRPDETIRMGFIGLGGRGQHMLGQFQKMEKLEVKAVCDVNQENLKKAAAMAPGAAAVEYYRNVLSRDDIDAVFIATPDHWHAIITIEACQAGKDVYVEKPLALCVAEGRRMVQAARKHGRIVQMGAQQRSAKHYLEARDLIQGGRLGKVTMVRVWNFRNTLPGRGHPADSDPPANLNWDLWLGPRPKVHFNRAYLGFRSFWAYAGGILTDWGTHHFDTIHMIMNASAPLTVSAAGGRFVLDDVTDIPDTLSVLYQYPGWTMEYSSREDNGKSPYDSEYGIEFCGSTGTMFLDRKGFKIFNEKNRDKPELVVGTPGVDNYVPVELDVVHIKNFLECVRSRQMPNTEVEIGHHSTIVSHLGNIAYRTKRIIRWDAERERIIGDAEADALLRRTYRKPYVLPEV